MDENEEPGRYRGSGVGNLLERRRLTAYPCDEPTPREILSRVVADGWTWQRFKTLKYFTVAEGLALHHYLDPDLLGLGRAQPLAIVEDLAWKLRDTPDNPVGRLVTDFAAARQAVRVGALRSVSAGSDPLQHLTTAEDFVDFVIARAFDTHEAYSWRLSGVKIPFAHTTPLLLLLSDLSGCWAVDGEGGTYTPGLMWTAPRVKAFAMSKGCSANLAEAMATIVRPSSAVPGRRPATPKWFKSLRNA